jgi:hypothetical protein
MMIRRLAKTYVGMVGVLCLVYFFALTVKGQTETKWQRVFTAEEFIVDVDPASLTFLTDHILSAKFRTLFLTPQATGGEPSKRYQDRIDTIEFKTVVQQTDWIVPPVLVRKQAGPAKSIDGGYRVVATSFLNATGQVIKSVADSASAWKSPAEITYRELRAARKLSPLGTWTVSEYRYAEAGKNLTEEPPELLKLIGSEVNLDQDAGSVEGNRCKELSYVSHQSTGAEFTRVLKTTPETLGLPAGPIETVKLNCEGGQWKPAQSLLIKLPEGGMLMLWDGVFLVLTKSSETKQNAPGKTLKRRG